MLSQEIKIKYIGGPTALLEIGGLRILTDPTFDPKGSAYPTAIYTLHKTNTPAIKENEIGDIDYVLLSHDHHFDNLDNSGRNFLTHVKLVITTPSGAERLAGNAIGIKKWQTIEIETPDNRILQITGTPCRHGPEGGDRGPVTGFVLQLKGEENDAVYITGDTVLYEGVIEVAERFQVKLVLLFFGAAVVKEVGLAHLTMTAEEGVEASGYFKQAKIIPLHYEGWGHFTESRAEIEAAFGKANLMDILIWPDIL